jgi:hypothetical protein
VGAILPAVLSVFGVSTGEVSVGADPLTDLLARALLVPLRELYAVLVRVGVVQILDEPSPEATCENKPAAQPATVA